MSKFKFLLTLTSAVILVACEENKEKDQHEINDTTAVVAKDTTPVTVNDTTKF